MPRLTIRTLPGKSAAKLRRVRRCTSVANSFPAARYTRCDDRVGEPVHERQSRVHLDRKPAVRRRDEHAATDPERLRDELALARASAHVLDHGVREDDVERAVREGQRARVALDVRDVRIAGAEPFAVVQAERRDALRPGIALLEEVHRRAAVSVPEAELVGSDVEHGRRGGRSQLVEKEPQLSLSRAQRDGVGEPHRVEVSAPHGSSRLAQ